MVSEPAGGATPRSQIPVIRPLCAAASLTLLVALLVAAAAGAGTPTRRRTPTGAAPDLPPYPLGVQPLDTAPGAARLRFGCDTRGCQQLDTPDKAREQIASAIFRGGQIDLTGDGRPEHVRREAEQIIIYADSVEVWRSPSDWRVVDAALGDPTNDGRGKVILALWKKGLDGLEPPDAVKENTPRSRPFIVGYRGGVYRTLWGGSAVSLPIHEIELGDVTGDGVQELVVLEGEERTGRTVSVWRWHGWGFTLIWRSAPGSYRDLIVGQDGMISVAVG